MRLLDRYILKSFFLPFLYCFIGIAAIWLIQDMGDKLPSLIDAGAPLGEILRFYKIQIPQITVFCLPIALLLSLLYSLSRLSRSNELVSMITAGVSMGRVLLPLLLAGVLFSGFSTYLNRRMAPESEIRRKRMFDELTQDRQKSDEQNAVLFRNRQGMRTWFFEKMGSERGESRGVQILQQNAAGDPVWKLYAKKALYDDQARRWTFVDGEVLELAADGKIIRQKAFKTTERTDLDETLWRIASADLKAQDLSVPALRNYLAQNGDFPRVQLAPFETHLYYRWSKPWTCLVVMLMGAPLGIVFSRRGVLGSVANALLLFFGMWFVDSLFLSLGEGARISPMAAAFAPVVTFGVIGLYVLLMRSAGRSLNPFRA